MIGRGRKFLQIGADDVTSSLDFLDVGFGRINEDIALVEVMRVIDPCSLLNRTR
jgi:hypothetical protein